MTPRPLLAWLQAKATSGMVGNLVAFTVLAALAASRAAHGVLSPAGLVAIVAGAAFTATTTGWVAGFYDGAAAAVRGEVDLEGIAPATEDRLAGRQPWRLAARWCVLAAGWSGAGAVVLAATLRHRSAPFPVVLIALVALAALAAVAVDLAARAAGVAHGRALAERSVAPTPVLTRAWRDLALPAAGVQALVNMGGAWVLFHRDAAAGTLSEATAFGDVLLVVAIVASLFGVLGAAWGRFDAEVGRITVPGRVPSSAPAGAPVGPQALIYAAALTLVATSAVRLLVPSEPTLLTVALARGVLAGGLTFLACGLGVVRGALNATVPAADEAAIDERRLLPPALRRARRPRRQVAVAAVVLLVVAASVLAVTGSTAAPARAEPLEGLGLVADFDAFAVRVEYDIPLPAGTGSVPQVVGAVRRTNGGEVANGVAAAPSRLDPVVGGTFADPDKHPGSGDENRPPQAECSYPSNNLADVAYLFPTDVRPETGDAPPIGHARAQCGAGPSVLLDAVTASPADAVDLGPAVSVAAGTADATAGPVEGVLHATASARASGISILDGLIAVDGVAVHGASATNGQAGGASTEAVVDLQGVEIAGTRFDLRAGELVAGGQSVPLGGDAARSLLASLSAALAPNGCSLSVLDTPTVYPQGFLFLRPEPLLGVGDDGTYAGSMTGGLAVQCDLPQDLTSSTDFNPQRVQVVLGFAYTAVTASTEPGGFGLHDVATGTPGGGAGGGLAPAPSVPAPAAGPNGAGAQSSVAAPAAAPRPAVSSPIADVSEAVRLFAANFADRTWVWVVALLSWLALTNVGIGRVRREVLAASAEVGR